MSRWNNFLCHFYHHWFIFTSQFRTERWRYSNDDSDVSKSKMSIHSSSHSIANSIPTSSAGCFFNNKNFEIYVLDYNLNLWLFWNVDWNHKSKISSSIDKFSFLLHCIFFNILEIQDIMGWHISTSFTYVIVIMHVARNL